jgi:predicted nucleic acid-binding protein
MITFWDTSAAINALVSPQVYDRLSTGRHVAKPHLLAEFFSIMTGRGIKSIDDRQQEVSTIMSAEETTEWLKEFCAKIEWTDLDATEVLNSLSKAQSLGVQGGRVYDYLHAEAARKAGAESFLTRNTKHFQGLTGAIPTEWP